MTGPRDGRLDDRAHARGRGLIRAARGRKRVFPYVRLARVMLAARSRPRVSVLDDSVVSFRVLPGDLDQNRHLNNGRYLTMMDLGRFELLSRAGLVGDLMKRRWYPVVTSATIRYRRSLDAWQKYDLRTRLLGWDDDGFYLEQRFERDGSVLAVGVIKGLFLGPNGKLPSREVAALLAPGVASPPLPEWVTLWGRSQEMLADELRSGAHPTR